MDPVDRVLKWTFNIFVFLICFQFGALIFLYTFYEKRKKEQIAMEPQVAFACGDFDNEKSYFPIPEAGQDTRTCLHQECPDSFWSINEQSQKEELHIVSAGRPLAHVDSSDGKGNGISIVVDVGRAKKPYTLVLSSRKDLTIWDLKLKDDHNLKKVILLNPGLTWVSGLSGDKEDSEVADSGIPIEYFSSKKICTYPLAWEEIANPNNEFRRLYKALKAHTGLDVTSFQGKKQARLFSLPPVTSKREVASELPIFAQSQGSGDSSLQDSGYGLRWQRADGRLQAKSFEYQKNGKSESIPVPDRTQKALYSKVDDKIYLIRKFDFGVWYPQEKKFQRLSIPLALPNMRWPTAMAFDGKRSRILVYNDERGGEIYIYSLKRKSWKRAGKAMGYSLSDLVYSAKEDVFYGTRITGGKITQILKINRDGQIMASRQIDRPKPFSRTLWHMKMAAENDNLWLWVFHPANPTGDRMTLKQIKASL